MFAADSKAADELDATMGKASQYVQWVTVRASTCFVGVIVEVTFDTYCGQRRTGTSKDVETVAKAPRVSIEAIHVKRMSWKVMSSSESEDRGVNVHMRPEWYKPSGLMQQ